MRKHERVLRVSGRNAMKTATAEQWHRNRKTHSWASLDGENWACSFCDTKTGSEPCPEGRMLDAQIEAHQQADYEERTGKE